MPQNSKKPTDKAILRGHHAKQSSPQAAAKPPLRGAKRSASAKAKPKAGTRDAAPKAKPHRAAPKKKPGPKRPVAPKAQAVSKTKPAAKGKLAPKAKAKLAPKAKAKLAPKAKGKAKPKLVQKVNVKLKPKARAASTQSQHASAPHTSKPTLAAPSLVAPAAALGLRMRERSPGARITVDTWRQVEASAAQLGRSSLTDEQRMAIRAALEGRDSLVVLADDERAVSCYQVAALHLAQPTVVVSPIHAELKAQSEALSQRKIPVVCLLPELSGPDRSAALARISRGGSLLVLLSPESLRALDVQQSLAKSGVALFVAEEAHCASDAAHELRPSYAELGVTLRTLGSPPVMALTRVATHAVRRDIGERLGLDAPVIVQSAVVRDNLKIVTKLARGEGRQASLVRLVERLELPGLVFCATPHEVDGVYAARCWHRRAPSPRRHDTR